MSTRELIENMILQEDVCEYCFGDVSQVAFSETVWDICKQDCKHYGRCWTCPPHCGELAKAIRKCQQYQSFCLFSTVTETENAWDEEACVRVKEEHEALARKILAELREQEADVYVLSVSRCMLCEERACPTEPCRHPEECLPSTKSHGIILMQLVADMGLCFDYGDGTVVYFSIIFFNE